MPIYKCTGGCNAKTNCVSITDIVVNPYVCIWDHRLKPTWEEDMAINFYEGIIENKQHPCGECEFARNSSEDFKRVFHCQYTSLFIKKIDGEEIPIWCPKGKKLEQDKEFMDELRVELEKKKKELEEERIERIIKEQKYGPIPNTEKRLMTEEERNAIEEALTKAATIDKDGNVLKYDEGKPDWSVMPWDALEEVVKVFEYGTEKYKKPFTYKKGIPVSQLFQSLMRHAIAWFFRREDIDPETDCNHLGHCVANALMILSYYKDKPEMDDRPNFTQFASGKTLHSPEVKGE